jgi:hypothetical protein
VLGLLQFSADVFFCAVGNLGSAMAVEIIFLVLFLFFIIDITF